jgi:hypothetical protein
MELSAFLLFLPIITDIIPIRFSRAISPQAGVEGNMISTVTTSTVSTITSAALFGTVGVIGILVLIMLLIQKEMISGSQDVRVLRMHRALNIAIVPLLVVFILLVATKIAEVLQ